VLPAAPREWGDAVLGQSVSGDGRTSVIEREDPLNNNVLLHLWSVAAGDPAGDYQIRVFVDGKSVATFRSW